MATLHRNVARHGLFLLGLAVLAIQSGCSHGRHSYNGSIISMSARADRVDDLQNRTLTHTISGADDQVVRIRHLAGRIEVVPTAGPDVEIEAVVHARGASEEHTAELLDAMQWTLERNGEGRNEWTLSWPLRKHQRYHYSGPDRGFEVTTNQFYRGTVTVTTETSPGTPTLFADLRIACPAHVPFHIDVLAGHIAGGDLAGRMSLDTAIGGVTLASFDGDLVVDTGSGDVVAGDLSGRARIDTGSGDIVITSMGAVGQLDTGSGDINLEHAESERVHADTGSGRIMIRDGSVATIHADTGSGDIELRHVEFSFFYGDTGAGDITIESSLTGAESIHADTGSGHVRILGGDDASFNLVADLGSGRVHVGYDDARIIHDGRWVIGAVRGDGRTQIYVDTGSGDCTVRPTATP